MAVAGLDAGGLIPAERVKRSLKILTHEVTVYFRNPALRESGVLPLGGIARFYGTATLHNAGPIRDEVWDRMVEPEKERDPNRQGRAVLIQIERAEDLRGNPLVE